MSPTQLHDQYVNKELPNNGMLPPPLEINKDSHFIKKLPSSSSSSSSTVINGIPSKPPQPRYPVIIYTHSPKVIHTHPRDFMALVQKLTGYSPSEDEPTNLEPKRDNKKSMINDDNESTSVVTDENIYINGSSNTFGDSQVISQFVPPNPGFNSLPCFHPNSTDILPSAPPFYNNKDSLMFMPKMGSSFSTCALDANKDLPEF